MEFNGHINNISVDYLTGNIKVEFEADKKENILELLSELKQEENKLTVKVSKYRKKRSKDANAYLWTLCGKLSEVLGSTKIEIYKEAISKVGQYEIIPIKDMAVKTFREVWEEKGIGFVTETLGPSKIEGYTNLIVYYGSSTYDTKSMTILLDYIVEECHNLGVDTKSKKEIDDLLEAWGKK